MTKFSGPFEDVEVREHKPATPEPKPWYRPAVVAVLMILGGLLALKDLIGAVMKAFTG